MNNRSKAVHTNQLEIHPDLMQVVEKHQNSLFNKPFTPHSLEVFQTVKDLYAQHSEHFILDSGCGVGESTLHIAQQNPDCFVLGIDQSQSRIERQNYVLPSNAQLVRTDCIDFWRLAAEADWKFVQHYILYPNPWPKKKHLLRRWHGHPVFPTLACFGGRLELRTNWKLYAEEFSIALSIIQRKQRKQSSVKMYKTRAPITPFERKYSHAGQMLYQVRTDFDE